MIDESEIKRCKKCNKILPMNYEYKKCEACRNQNAHVIKKAGKGACAVVTGAVAVAAFIARGGKK